MRNWAGLLQELLCLICKRMDSMKDLVAFGGVCSPWRRVAVEQNLGLPLSTLPFPWLMLPENQDDDFRDFYSVTEGKTYSFNLPELRGKMCKETKGWVVTSSNKGEMALVHPLTHVVIPLPHQNISKLREEHEMGPLRNVVRVVLSSPPDPKNEKDCVVVILFGCLGHVEFCRPGDKVWTVVDNNFGCCIQSLEYYRGKIYVATNFGEIWEYDIIGKSNDIGHVSPRRIKVNIREYTRRKESYLVESAGSLLVVIRDGVDEENYGDTKFWVLEIDVEHDTYEEVMSLGTRAIFLGHSATLSVDTMRYPKIIPNSIYFTDDCCEAYFFEPEGGGKNMGIYDLEDSSIRPHYDGKSLSLVCPPVWTFLTIK